jgi:hypothetical protein
VTPCTNRQYVLSSLEVNVLPGLYKQQLVPRRLRVPVGFSKYGRGRRRGGTWFGSELGRGPRNPYVVTKFSESRIYGMAFDDGLIWAAGMVTHVGGGVV